jgi:hypothetical protein
VVEAAPFKEARPETESVPERVVFPAERVSAPMSIAPKPDVMEPVLSAPADVMLKRVAPVESTKRRKSPVCPAVEEAKRIMPPVDVARRVRSELKPAKSEEPINMESSASLGRRKLPPSVHSEEPLPPTQEVPIAKHPDAREIPFANVEVAPPVWFRAKRSTPPANVEVEVLVTERLVAVVEPAPRVPPTVVGPKVEFPAVSAVAKRLVEEAVAEKRLVVVAALPVALTKVKFCRVEEAFARMFSSVAKPED